MITSMMTDQEVTERFSFWARAARARLGVSLSEVARRMGTYPSHVSRMESGLNQPTIGVALRFAAALETDLPSMLKPIPKTHRKKSQAAVDTIS